MLLEIHEPGQTPLPHEDEKIAVGIDLGTTNTVVALSDSGKVEVLRDENGVGMIPSVVAYSRNGAISVGDAARNLIGEEGFEVISSIKRLMGRSGVEVEKISGNLRHSLVEIGEGMAQLDVWGRKISPVEISAEILKTAKHRAEVALGHKVEQAVITIPAYFDDAARAATRDAANVAGLEVLRMIAEPTAAALAYGLDKGAEGLYAVYDLGGGTFDFSLLRMEKGVFQVLATGGNTRLGGDDFDKEIAEKIVASSEFRVPSEEKSSNSQLATRNSLTPHELNQLLKHARIIKEQLTNSENMKHEFALCYRKINAEISKNEFEALIQKYVAETISIMESVLADAGVAKTDVKGVVMVGGSTRVPLVQRMVGEFFGKIPLTDVNPDEVVAYGAAIQAEGLTKGSDNLLLDVTPLSLGIETMGGIAEKIISRNTPIPVSIAQEFTTYADNQTGMKIHVVQGEREMVSDCRSLARFELLGIPPLPAGVARIRVTFTVDADGLLSVSAREETTGNIQRVEVRPTYGLETTQIEEMLRSSYQHASDDIESRMLAETKVEAERLLLSLQGAMERNRDKLSADEEIAINKAMRELKVAIGSGDRDLISYKSGLLEQQLQNFAAKIMDEAVSKVLKGSNIENMESGLDKNKAA